MNSIHIQKRIISIFRSPLVQPIWTSYSDDETVLHIKKASSFLLLLMLFLLPYELLNVHFAFRTGHLLLLLLLLLLFQV